MDSPLIISQKKQSNFYGSKISLLSPAKINLYLNIVGEYSSGYRRIESLVERVSLFDRVCLEVVSGKKISIFSNLKSLESKNNFAYKAAQLMKKKFNISSGLNIYLKKNIPLGSGLGGGSSNAASVVLGINKLFSLNAPKSELYKIGEKIGSDVNFFISESSYAYLSGRGEKVTPLSGMKKLCHYIVWPGIFLSTKEVYKNYTAKLTRFFSSDNMVKYSLKNKDTYLLQQSIYNCLEKSAFLLSGKLAELKKFFFQKNIRLFMSGSGSAFYTVSWADGGKLEKLLPLKWPVFKVKTF